MNAAPSPSIVVRDGRRVVRVEGSDRRSFLDATLSQSIADLQPGQHRGALWLDVHGSPLAAMDVVAEPGDQALLLVTVADGVAPLVETLAMRTFLSEASFRLTDDIVVAVRGRQVEVGGAVVAAGSVVSDGPVLAIGRDAGVDLLGSASAVAETLEACGLGEAVEDDVALQDWEIRNGVPRVPHEIVAPHLPEEAGVLPTHVHLSKGCYPGQEAVARMWMLGRPRRRLAILDVQRGTPLAGDEVGAGRERVTVTRVTTSSPVAALAYVPSSAVVGDPVVGEEWQARIARLVGEGRPQPGADPAVTRRRDRVT